MVVFGAGASYDSIPSRPPNEYPPFKLPDRLPLANELFDDRTSFINEMSRFHEIQPIIPYLQKLPSDRPVERVLEGLQAEAEDYPIRLQQLTWRLRGRCPPFLRRFSGTVKGASPTSPALEGASSHHLLAPWSVVGLVRPTRPAVILDSASSLKASTASSARPMFTSGPDGRHASSSTSWQRMANRIVSGPVIPTRCGILGACCFPLVMRALSRRSRKNRALQDGEHQRALGPRSTGLPQRGHGRPCSPSLAACDTLTAQHLPFSSEESRRERPAAPRFSGHPRLNTPMCHRLGPDQNGGFVPAKMWRQVLLVGRTLTGPADSSQEQGDGHPQG